MSQCLLQRRKKKWKGIGLGPAPCPSSPAPSPLSPAPASPTSTLSTNFIHLNNFKTKSATEKKGRKIEAKNKKKKVIYLKNDNKKTKKINNYWELINNSICVGFLSNCVTSLDFIGICICLSLRMKQAPPQAPPPPPRAPPLTSHSWIIESRLKFYRWLCSKICFKDNSSSSSSSSSKSNKINRFVFIFFINWIEI